jgi:hypothetical protein
MKLILVKRSSIGQVIVDKVLLVICALIVLLGLIEPTFGHPWIDAAWKCGSFLALYFALALSSAGVRSHRKDSRFLPLLLAFAFVPL